MLKNPDIFGQAVLDFHHQQQPENIIVHSEDFDDDEIPTDYLFRSYEEMPILEQKALQLAEGKILDVGSCAGSHSLYLQQQNKEVKAIDVSEGAIEVCQLRGVKNAEVKDFFQLKNEQFDTILMLMNGSGIIGKLKNLTQFFQHVKTLLKPNGKILIDSSDLRYLFDEDEDGGIWVNPNKYYGELSYSISYKNETSTKFDWLYIDFNSLQLAAQSNEFSCELIKEGEHFDYLAMLKMK
ncbi:class I SAM-dependent methyltransferase [Mesonia aestuariivivens]|uniref:Class I SAM-dependent methyltransferase n=1 Tax=Mesonia aestuariivivens TaxID=2796128 RepID=A0ABS6VZ19_9FLAO|nr:class I SAM-dependent methyltransferase [Mesonia aestuariivivens]